MKRKFLYLCFLMFIVLSFNIFSIDTGIIKGKVIVEETGKPMPNATILIEGTKLGAYSAKDGSFTIKNVPVGKRKVSASYMGFGTQFQTIELKSNQTVELEFTLSEIVYDLGTIVVSANRAVERETPIAFTNVKQEKLQQAYTTQDMPQLLTDVPGVFSSSSGLGESDLKMRGFDAERIQILINGIPVNDPESQVVYWSNWTGLSSNVKSVQVQRGAGSSLYGSGAFGGSLNIETMGLDPARSITFKTSFGFYNTQGAKFDTLSSKNKVADGKGGFGEYNPMNYNFSIKYNSGLFYNDMLNFSLMFERKAGESYMIGTDYDGYSFGFEGQAIVGDHRMLLSFIGAPQEHNQARTNSDMALMDRLGREYNRYNHEYQENYYFKPQLSFRDEWKISLDKELMTNVFVTMGNGGGKYLYNDVFDVKTGKVGYKKLALSTDKTSFGRHARYIYERTGVVLTGYNPADTTFEGSKVTASTNLPNGDRNHSWLNDSVNNHKQFGFNTYYQQKISEMLKVILGGEMRYWVADHYAETKNFRYCDPTKPDSVGIYKEVERRYDYTGKVLNMSSFLRVQGKPLENLTLMGDLQFSYFTAKVEENPIKIFDFRLGKFTGDTYYATKTLKKADGTLKFKEDDYKKTFSFLSPKVGANYNITEEINVMSNFSIAYKEPKVTDWYNRSNGPNANQTISSTGEIVKLNPERTITIEFGGGYQSKNLNFNLNYYHTNYKDRIESVTDFSGNRLTINAGSAIHQGIELTAGYKVGYFTSSLSFTKAWNRWKEMNFKIIFGDSAKFIKDKVVPFSPELQLNGNVGYAFTNMPLNGKLGLNLGFNYWDDYYGSYTNTYKLIDGTVVSSKLPSFFELNAIVDYSFKIKNKNTTIRLNFNNITNRENYASASYTSDSGRNDALNGKPYMYVAPAPLFNMFATIEFTY